MARLFVEPLKGCQEVIRTTLRESLPGLGYLAFLSMVFLVPMLAGCSAPGPVLPAPEDPVLKTEGLFEMEPLEHRFRNNLHAYLRLEPSGRAEIWQLSLSGQNRLHLLQFQGRVYGRSSRPFEIRMEKCFIYEKDTPDADLVAVEVFQCDHLGTSLRQSAGCRDCLVTGPLSLEEDLNMPSRFLHNRLLQPLNRQTYSGKKIAAYSNSNQVWYWGPVPDGGSLDTGPLPMGSLETVVDGFVLIRSTKAPAEVRIPLKNPDSDLF